MIGRIVSKKSLDDLMYYIISQRSDHPKSGKQTKTLCNILSLFKTLSPIYFHLTFFFHECQHCIAETVSRGRKNSWRIICFYTCKLQCKLKPTKTSFCNI